MKPQTKTYKHVIDLYFESVPHSIRTFSVHGNTLIYIEYEDYLSEHHVTEALRRLLGTSVLSVSSETVPSGFSRKYSSVTAHP